MHWTDSYHQKWFHKEPVKMYLELIPYICLHQHQFYCHWHGALQFSLESKYQPISAAQMWPMSAQVTGLLEDRLMLAVSCLLKKGNLTHLKVVPLSSAFLLPGNLTPFAGGPSCPPCQNIPWSWITTAELWFKFPLQAVSNQPGLEKSQFSRFFCCRVSFCQFCLCLETKLLVH